MATPAATIVRICRQPALPGLELVRGMGVTADIVRHAHARLVVGLCLGGSRRIVTPDSVVTAGEGGGFVIAPGLVHACGPGEGRGHSYLVLAAGPEAFDASRRAGSCERRPLLWHDGVAKALLLRLAGAMEAADGGALALWRELVVRLDLRHAPLPGLHPAVGLAKALVDAAPQASFSVAFLARRAGVSPYYLERLFVRELGVPLGEYVLARRVALAARRIGCGLGLADAALAAGFCDQSHLNRHFRRRVGVSPGRYRVDDPDTRPVRP